MRRTLGLTEIDVAGIKRDLWAGDKQEKIAAKYEVTQTTISFIMDGRLHPRVPWPDGSLVGMPLHQRGKIAEMRYMIRKGLANAGALPKSTNLPEEVRDKLAEGIARDARERAEERTRDFKKIFPDWK